MMLLSCMQRLQSCASQIRTTLASDMQAISTRALATKASLARGKRLRRGGAIPGTRFGGKTSVEMRYRSESILQSIRDPIPVKDPVKKWKILRGDFVEVISGQHVGQRGRVLEVVRASNSVVVQGVNVVRELVPQPDSERKKPMHTEAPISMPCVAVVCPVTDKPTRVGYAFLEDGTKVRIAKKSGAIIPRPEILRQRRVQRAPDSPKDTPSHVVLKRTFLDEDGLYEKYAGFKSLVDKENTN